MQYDEKCRENKNDRSLSLPPIDDRSCDDDPCFQDVECIDLDPMSIDFTQPFVRLFECGECPEDYSGDGIECISE